MPGQLALTFDDGPDEGGTPAILSALARHGVRATFFMIGERVEACPVLAASVLGAGHDVQLHCHRHLRHTEMSEQEIESDARAGLRALRRIGVEPLAWRTPWGAKSSASEAVAARLNLALVGWEHDSHDWRGDPAPAMLDAIGGRLGGGGSVLMHDGLGPGSRRTSVLNTVELLTALAALARRDGFTLGALSPEPATAGPRRREHAPAGA